MGLCLAPFLARETGKRALPIGLYHDGSINKYKLSTNYTLIEWLER